MKDLWRKIIYCILCVTMCISFNSSVKANDNNTMDISTIDLNAVMQTKIYTNTNIANFDLPYRIYVPENYSEDKKYAVLLYLHGAGERGNDNILQINSTYHTETLMKQIIDNSTFKDEFIIIAPQCPNSMQWVDYPWSSGTYDFADTPQSDPSKLTMDLLQNQIFTNYSVDLSRIYISGVSMGGFGAWDMVARYPDLFAAAVPVCGGVDISTAGLVSKTPIWTFHCINDSTVNPNPTKQMVNSLQQINAPIYYTEYTDVGHNSWIPAYQNQNMISWLASRIKNSIGTIPQLDINIAIDYGTPISSNANARLNINVLNDNDKPDTNSGVYIVDTRQFDTWTGATAAREDYFGYSFNQEHNFKQLIFQEGMHWSSGGWFANGNIKLQVRQNGEWKDIDATLDTSYPNANDMASFGASFESYTFNFDPVKGDGIRIIGAAGGTEYFVSCAELQVFEGTEIVPVEDDENTLTEAEVMDKLKGAWVGQMAGVTWGFPTEFKALGRMLNENEIPTWSPSMINGAFDQDDLYVEIPFMNAMKNKGVDCDVKTLGDYFKNTKFQLWHANLIGRSNLQDGINAPDSGSYLYNPHCDDLDWQIESDFVGQMSPGMVNSAIQTAWKAGHVMCYGDGVYGGVYMSAMHAKAYTANSIDEIIQTGRSSVPIGSKFRQLIEDVIKWYCEGNTYQQTYNLLESKWGSDDRCPNGRGVDSKFNIDAKLNSGYVLMGLLYGEGDLEKTMKISMLCGQDSDCNPSSSGGILGNYLGLSNIPDKFKSALNTTGTNFSYIEYNFNEAVSLNFELAKKMLEKNGGSITDEIWNIPNQENITPPELEQWVDQPTVVLSATYKDSYTVTFYTDAFDKSGLKSFEWDFGDGEKASGYSIDHTYDKDGEYIAICTVISKTDKSTIMSIKVSIHNNIANEGNPIITITNPQGAGIKDINIIKDGVMPNIATGTGNESYDTFRFGSIAHEEFVGYTFSKTHKFNGLLFQEGLHFQDGGWFAQVPEIQVRQNGQWINVIATVSPVYQDENIDSGTSFGKYNFYFNEMEGDGIRLIGNAGGTSHFISVAELQVYAAQEVLTEIPTTAPTTAPTAVPTAIPTPTPTTVPTSMPTTAPTTEVSSKDTVIASINAIPSTITLSNQTAIIAARAAYNALTAEEKALVTNYNQLVVAEQQLAALNAANIPSTGDTNMIYVFAIMLVVAGSIIIYRYKKPIEE